MVLLLPYSLPLVCQFNKKRGVVCSILASRQTKKVYSCIYLYIILIFYFFCKS